MDESFEKILLSDDKDKLNELKRWLFEENIRLEIKQKEMSNMYDKFLKERVQFVEEMKAINLRNVTERKRLKDEEQFFDKKMEILKNGFADLDADRRKLQAEKEAFEEMRRKASNFTSSINLSGTLFAGVNSALALKKRYRDLLKIFHPDNACGDNEMVSIITKEYEKLKNAMDYSFKSVK